MTHGSLFSGIGGFDYAASLLNWTNTFQCEIDSFCQKVLKYHFPNTIQYDDIKKTDFSRHKGAIDVISGGLPCQPFSVAGKRKGTADDRYLWAEMLRAIREVSPRWVVGENVLGIVNWSGGLVFEQVCADLENAGYEVQPFVIPACAVNAPHKRDRLWIVAYSPDAGAKSMQRGWKDGVYGTTSASDTTGEGLQRQIHSPVKAGKRIIDNFRKNIAGHTITNTGILHGWSICGQESKQQTKNQVDSNVGVRTWWENFPTQPPVCCQYDEFSARLDGITFPKWRAKSIKAYGNAVVPALVLQIFKTIEEYEKL